MLGILCLSFNIIAATSADVPTSILCVVVCASILCYYQSIILLASNALCVWSCNLLFAFVHGYQCCSVSWLVGCFFAFRCPSAPRSFNGDKEGPPSKHSVARLLEKWSILSKLVTEIAIARLDVLVHWKANQGLACNSDLFDLCDHFQPPSFGLPCCRVPDAMPCPLTVPFAVERTVPHVQSITACRKQQRGHAVM